MIAITIPWWGATIALLVIAVGSFLAGMAVYRNNSQTLEKNLDEAKDQIKSLQTIIANTGKKI